MSPLRILRPLHEDLPRPRALIVVPLALIAAVTVLDITAPPDIHLGPFLVAAPALTASFAGPRTTAIVGAVAVLAQSLVGFVRTSINDLNHTYQIAALFLISVIVTFFAHVRVRHAREMSHLRWVAQAVQRVVMPALPERTGTLRIASRYLAAEAEAQLGGDLYALARTSGGTRVIIGDVRGKGLEAMGEAAQVLGAFRSLTRQEPSLPHAVAQLEAGVAAGRDGLPADGDTDRGTESFVTAAVLDIPDTGPEFSLVSCGHPAPLLLRSGQVRTLGVDEPAPPLGLGSLLAGAAGTGGAAPTPFTAQTFPFGVGDILLLFTDGVIESRDSAGRFYPLSERIATFRAAGPDALLGDLCADLLRHADGSLGDDAAMVAIERLPAP
ncbi:serine/threonine-protein phosphatase [Streptomyces sp. SID10853]|uniref:PP2C family protein-serine/threonine phosphatase n=1 Tax=Streptomyces sp. SID10853 TaxID=2706028 RepID=UPI0013C125B3|nr:PP2C family protein-serine/threonine phosphatase [Streptomyces sp. SID10853]NDZ77660.1 serine/threonine-protein phosphatase [Streptomyces sp. SID10853]